VGQEQRERKTKGQALRVCGALLTCRCANFSELARALWMFLRCASVQSRFMFCSASIWACISCIRWSKSLIKTEYVMVHSRYFVGSGSSEVGHGPFRLLLLQDELPLARLQFQGQSVDFTTIPEQNVTKLIS